MKINEDRKQNCDLWSMRRLRLLDDDGPKEGEQVKERPVCRSGGNYKKYRTSSRGLREW